MYGEIHFVIAFRRFQLTHPNFSDLLDEKQNCTKKITANLSIGKYSAIGMFRYLE